MRIIHPFLDLPTLPYTSSNPMTLTSFFPLLDNSLFLICCCLLTPSIYLSIILWVTYHFNSLDMVIFHDSEIYTTSLDKQWPLFQGGSLSHQKHCKVSQMKSSLFSFSYSILDIGHCLATESVQNI